MPDRIRYFAPGPTQENLMLEQGLPAPPSEPVSDEEFIRPQKTSFAQAFRSARKQYGANGTFVWNGKKYSTKLKGESSGATPLMELNTTQSEPAYPHSPEQQAMAYGPKLPESLYADPPMNSGSMMGEGLPGEYKQGKYTRMDALVGHLSKGGVQENFWTKLFSILGSKSVP